MRGTREVVHFLAAVPGMRRRAGSTTAYAAGLRVSEAVNLKITDIDSERMIIRVERGKGGKDRYVILSARILPMLPTGRGCRHAAPVRSSVVRDKWR
jgi:integrase/recombinase XerD